MVRKSGRRERREIDGDTAHLPQDHGPTLEGSGESHVLYRMPGHLIRRLQQVAVSLFMEEVGSANITPVQYAALMAIKTYPRIDQASLAGVIAFDRATIGGVVDRLETKGLVRRATSPNDRRLRLLILEAKGEALLLRLAASVGRAQERILAPLSAKEGRQFMTLLTKLVVENNERSRAPMRPVTHEKRLAAAQPRAADGARVTSRTRRLRASPVA